MRVQKYEFSEKLRHAQAANSPDTLRTGGGTAKYVWQTDGKMV
ncbi:hypothetical protein [Microcoleus sp.]